jgi:hypothetical protein
MHIYSQATAKEVRDEIGNDDQLDLHALASAVMVLCSRVAELQAEVDELKKSTVSV